MKYRDETDMGGEREKFLTTHWSLIENIRTSEDKDRALIGLLIERYWKPVYFYLRRKGYDNEKTKDLTQGFFHEIVLNRNLVQRADQSKGRFRSFLLHALEQYFIDVRHKQAARKRIPKEKLVSLNVVEPPILPQAVSQLAPEDSYNYGWMSALLNQVLSEVRTRCYEQVMEIHWKVFYDRIVQPILQNVAPPSLADVCQKYGVQDQKKASNMAITVKRRFQAALKEYVRSTVASEREMDEELGEIMQFFSKMAQPSE